jgi:hypothetical protein
MKEINETRPSWSCLKDEFTNVFWSARVQQKLKEQHVDLTKEPAAPHDPEMSPPAPSSETKNPLQFHIPGYILHIYHDRGAFRAAVCDYKLDGLQRVELVPNMVHDHRSRNMMRALRGVYTSLTSDIPSSAERYWEVLPESSTSATCAICKECVQVDLTGEFESTRLHDKALKHCSTQCGRIVCHRHSKLPLSYNADVSSPRVCDVCFLMVPAPVAAASSRKRSLSAE